MLHHILNCHFFGWLFKFDDIFYISELKKKNYSKFLYLFIYLSISLYIYFYFYLCQASPYYVFGFRAISPL